MNNDILCLVFAFLFINFSDGKSNSKFYFNDLEKPFVYNETLSPVIEDVTVLSSCSINVSWSCNECSTYTVLNYIVHWNDEMQEVGNDVFNYVTDGLLANELYKIYVSAVYEGEQEEYESITSEVTTEHGDPPDITDIDPYEITDTRIYLRWNTSNDDCPIQEYIIRFEGKILCNVSRDDSGSDISTEKELILYGLNPYTNYTIYIAAAANDGVKGKESTLEGIVTKEGVPGPPVSLKSEAQSQTSIQVNWEAPHECNGEIINYKISWKFSQTSTLIGNTSTTETTVQIDGLESCGEYEFDITAETSVGEGVPASTMTRTDPEVPPPVTELTTSNITSTTVQLDWVPPDTLCPVIEYTIEITGSVLWNDTDTIRNTTVNGLTISHVLQYLIPWTDYTFCVLAQTDGGFSDLPCTSAQTLQDIPSKPTNLLVQTLSTTEVSVQWDQPEMLNGILTNYKVTWKSEDTTLDFLTTEETDIVVGGLFSCLSYDINVMGVNEIGDGFPATGYATLFPEPPPPPKITRCETRDSRTIEVEWKAPDTTCPINSYTVLAEGTNLWDGNPTEGSEQTLELQLTLTELVPYTAYVVSLMATTGGGMSPSSLCSQTTDQDVPSEPTNLTVDYLTSTDVMLNWNPPLFANGIITYYNVSWEAENVTKLFETTKEIELEVSDLFPCVNYEMSVTGATIAGEGIPATVNVVLNDQVPSAPTNTRCEITDSNTIELEWDDVDSTCPVINYEVIVKETILYNGTEIYFVEETDEPQLTLTDLVPYTNYLLTIRAITIGNIGLPSFCSQTTDEEVPGSPTDLKVKEGSITASGFSITWNDPLVVNGNLKGFNITLSNGEAYYVSYTKPNVVHEQRFDNLESSTQYTTKVYAETGAGYGVPSEITTETLSSIYIEIH